MARQFNGTREMARMNLVGFNLKIADLEGQKRLGPKRQKSLERYRQYREDYLAILSDPSVIFAG